MLICILRKVPTSGGLTILNVCVVLQIRLSHFLTLHTNFSLSDNTNIEINPFIKSDWI